MDGADFRAELYRRYVSTFRGSRVHLEGPAGRAYQVWCERKYLPRLSGLPPDAPILELGCGAGFLLEFLERQGFRDVLGIDVSTEQIAVAVERGLPAEVADAFDYLPTRPRHFWAIIAIDFLEHFTREEVLRLLPLIHAALRPGGRLIVQTANGQGLMPNQVIYGDFTHLTIFSPESLAQVLRVCGFERIECFETGPAAGTLRDNARVLLWEVVKMAANTVRRIESARPQRIWTQNFIACARAARMGS